MKSKRLMSIIMMIVIFITTIFGFSSTAFADSNPVKLLFSKTTPYYGAEVGFYFSGYVEVENLAYAKNVTVYYSTSDAPDVFKSVPATYVKSTDSTHEAWFYVVFIPYNTYKGHTIVKHYVKYDINGSSYIDDNNGAYYRLGYGYDPGVPQINLAKSELVLDQASILGNTLSGYIYLKNIDYDKDVKVRYTLDDWATYEEVYATYNSSLYSSGFELWSFSTGVPIGVSGVKFAISYTANGITYWDNNFDRNYTVSAPGTVSTFEH
ncbi:MAG: CBM21 domain-containing protein [Clostridia bacterium]|nr:CBM21 domain-containing protein [Clostridia bacterium]